VNAASSAKLHLNKRLVTILLLISATSSVLLGGDNLDLTGMAKSAIRPYLLPYLSTLTAEESIPIALLPDRSFPMVIVGSRFNPVTVIDWSKAAVGVPSFWLAVNVAPAVVLGGALQAGEWQGAGFNAMNMFLSYSTGAEGHPNYFSCQITHVKGFDDFHFRNLSLSYAKTFHIGNWLSGLGFYYDFLQCDIYITDNVLADQNYRTTKNFSISRLQISLGKKLNEALKIGLEVNLSRRSTTSGITCFYCL